MKHFLVFGTHPRLSLAEFKAVKPNLERPTLVNQTAIVDDSEWNGEALMNRLGGTVKLGDIIADIPVEQLGADVILDTLRDVPRGDSIDFGFTIIGGTKAMTTKKGLKLPLELKKKFKERGVKSRWVTSKEGTLSPAAVAKLNLTTEGYDIVCLIEKETAHIGLTTHVQNADAWSERDYGRPRRDDTAGMLPPKLARMMVNLACVEKGDTVLDPFCGNGAVLMESALATEAGKILGSDIEKRQTDSCEENLNWLIEQAILKEEDWDRTDLFTADVLAVGSHLKPQSVDRVITEGSLGPPLRGSEPKTFIDKNKEEISTLWMNALRALSPVIKPEGLLVVIWPSFKTTGGIARVQLDDEMDRLGYEVVNPLGDWDETNNPLIYHREGQRVARRIVVLRKTAS